MTVVDDSSYCTYTPGFSTVPGDIDPDTLAPSGFLISSEFSEIISEETHASLAAPGFQRGEDVSGGTLVGVSVDVLNAGFASDGGASSLNATRTEETSTSLIPTLAHVEQTLAINSREAAATRSVRAFVTHCSSIMRQHGHFRKRREAPSRLVCFFKLP